MSAETRGGERRFVDTNLFVYAYGEGTGRKREVARDLTAGQDYDGVRVVNPMEVGAAV